MKSEVIASGLRQRIEDGRLPPHARPANALPPGTQLPTVDELAATHHTDRNTAHRVYGLLKKAGLIHTRSGRNAIVADPSPLYVVTSDTYDRALTSGGLTAWEMQVTETGDEPETEHYQGHLALAPDLGLDARWTSVADLLDVADDIELLHLAGDGWSTPVGPTGKPDKRLKRVVQIYDAWYHPSVPEAAPKLLDARDESWAGGAFKVIYDETGRRAIPIRHIITERISTKAEEVRFHVPPLTPISSHVEVSVDQHAELLCVVWYRRLYGVVQWDLA